MYDRVGNGTDRDRSRRLQHLEDRPRHTHRFREADGGTLVHDRVVYELALGPVGALVHAALGQDGVVTLTQKRFLNHGVEPPRPQSWKIPVTLMYLARGTPRTLNVVLDRERTTVRLPRGDRPAPDPTA